MHTNKTYIPAIDSLRAIAAIMVVLEHSGAFLCWRGWKETSFLNSYNLGFGVDLFFVISGFVVYSSIVPMMPVLRNNFMQFWFSFLTRRFFRLAPICLFWLLIVLTLAHKLSTQYFLDYHAIQREATGIVLYLYNYMCAFKFYLLEGSPFYLGYHHSLNTEEQFYFFLPILIFLFKEKPFFCISLLIILSGFLFQRPLVWYYFRYDSFFYGIILAYLLPLISQRHSQLPLFLKKSLRMIIGPILLWTAITWLAHVHYHTIHERMFETAALISLFILTLVCFGVRPLIREKWDACLVYIGKRSYTLYLTHIPTFMILNACIVKLGWANNIDSKIHMQFTIVESVLIGLTAISVLWLFVEISYKYIEMPGRNLGKKLSSRYGYKQPEKIISAAPHTSLNHQLMEN